MTQRRCATILLVDDDVAFAGALRTLLEGGGHSVHQVLDGEEALRRVAALGSDLDAILLDLLLPKKSGFDVVKELVERQCTVPVLVMTGVYSEAREIQALRMLGVAGWIHKSARFDHFLYRVNDLLHPVKESTRNAPRVVTSIPVTFHSAGRSCYAASYNLSASGLYVRTNEPVTVGDVIDLVLVLPTAKEPVHVSAEIVHSASAESVVGTAYPAGFGARFEGLTPLAAAAIRRLVDALHAEATTGELPRASAPLEDADIARDLDAPENEKDDVTLDMVLPTLTRA